LDEVWREIEKVAPPYVPPLPSSQALVLAPSAEAEATARRKQNSFYLAILMSLVSGFAIGLWVGFPFALLLLFVAGFVIQRLTGSELDAGVQTLWQRPLAAADDPLTRQFEQAKQQAEAKLRQLAERWKNEASEEPFHARLRELESWKVAYESLSFKRTQQIKRLEEQTRARQLERFLAQFELDKTVLKNFAPAFYENLRVEGIRTAADVTSARLRRAPLMGAGLAQILLNWRNELERDFAFDPQTAVPPHLRFKLESKLDETRVRLEHDLRGGAFYLNRLKDEIKESQQALHAPLLAAQTALAQAEKDCEAVAKRNRFAPLAVCLLLAFFFGVFWKAGKTDERRLVDNIARIERTQEAKQDPTQSWKFAEAQQLYEQGTESLKKGKYEEAIAHYQHAITYNPKLAAAHHQLGYAYYRLKRYDKARTALLASLAIRKGFRALLRFRAGLL
jgi:tetratricopeptide (TPR) repeat protein